MVQDRNNEYIRLAKLLNFGLIIRKRTVLVFSLGNKQPFFEVHGHEGLARGSLLLGLS